MPTLSRITSRRGSLHQQRLPDLLHEEENTDRAERTGQGSAKIWQPCLVEMIWQPCLVEMCWQPCLAECFGYTAHSFKVNVNEKVF